MFDINQYYKHAHSGECVENTALLKASLKLSYGEGVFLETLSVNIYWKMG